MLTVKQIRVRHVGPVDFELTESECLVLSGSSGAGKTLLLRGLCDLEPHEGMIFLDKLECRQVRPAQWRRQVALLPAESQWWHDRVKPHFRDMDADRFGLLGFAPDVMEWSVSRLSTGERQRLALLRLLCNRPRVLLLDEPTANLDPKHTRSVEILVEQYRTQEKAAVIWVAHDGEQIKRVADRHLVLKDGLFHPGEA